MAVEVRIPTGKQTVYSAPGGAGQGRLEGAVAVAQRNVDDAGIGKGGGYIELAVVVEIGNRHARGASPEQFGTIECAISVSHPQAHAIEDIADHQVGLAIAIEVANGDTGNAVVVREN